MTQFEIEVMPMVAAQNPCAKLQCSACCQNTEFSRLPLFQASALIGANPYYSVSDRRIYEDFRHDPSAPKIVVFSKYNHHWHGKYDPSIDAIEQYRLSRRWADTLTWVLINGTCPQLEDGYCQIYTDPNKPLHCKNFKFNGISCRITRFGR